MKSGKQEEKSDSDDGGSLKQEALIGYENSGSDGSQTGNDDLASF